MKQNYYEYGGTLFVTHMMCVSLCFPENGAVIHQALRSMESKSTTHSTQTTLQNLCEFAMASGVFDGTDLDGH